MYRERSVARVNASPPLQWRSWIAAMQDSWSKVADDRGDSVKPPPRLLRTDLSFRGPVAYGADARRGHLRHPRGTSMRSRGPCSPRSSRRRPTSSGASAISSATARGRNECCAAGIEARASICSRREPRTWRCARDDRPVREFSGGCGGAAARTAGRARCFPPESLAWLQSLEPGKGAPRRPVRASFHGRRRARTRSGE